MSGSIPLFEINPKLDVTALQARFVQDRRVQIRNLLTDRTARVIHDILQCQTPWGLAWQAGLGPPNMIANEDLRKLTPDQRRTIQDRLANAMRGRDYGFHYMQYPMLDAYLQKWRPDGPHDLLLEHINDQPFLDLVRQVTGLPSLIKADAQATLYGTDQFLSLHDDSHVAQGWRVAYVLNLCALDWRPEWGGYLNFYDADGDIVAGFRPRFNALNLFAVPQSHNVSYVPSFAPIGRFAITGWFRDR